MVHGLTRVRGMTQDDAHIFTTREQMGEELQSLLDFHPSLLSDYGLDDFYLGAVDRSLRREGASGSDEEWDEATEALRQAAMTKELELVMDPGGAFTGRRSACRRAMRSVAPGRCRRSSWTSSTPQLFDMHYAGADSKRHRPIMIHRALFGSVERFFAVLTEHYAGAFPLWLAPEQLRLLPVADRNVDAAHELAARARAAGLRVEVDDSKQSVGKKIRAAQLMKTPYAVVLEIATSRPARVRCAVAAVSRRPASRSIRRSSKR